MMAGRSASSIVASIFTATSGKVATHTRRRDGHVVTCERDRLRERLRHQVIPTDILQGEERAA